MGSLFNISNVRSDKKSDLTLLKKTKLSKIKLKKGETTLDKIKDIKENIQAEFRDVISNFEAIRDAEDLNIYGKSIVGKLLAIDTETTGLNPMVDDIIGLSLYDGIGKAVYIPINHVNYITTKKLDNQISKEELKKFFEQLILNDIKFVFFNAVFDYRIIKNNIGIELPLYWDGYVAGRLLNENEGDGSNDLKTLHGKYCLEGDIKYKKFDKITGGLPFDMIPVELAYLYGANDAKITWELFKFQEPYLTKGHELCVQNELEGVSDVYFNIELPVIYVIAEMENTGIYYDLDFAKSLEEKYIKLMKEKEEKFLVVCAKEKSKIDLYHRKNKNNKLSEPINIASPIQLAILLYDILGLKNPLGSGRGTGEEILVKIKHPIAKVILEYREISKLLTTYITKMVKIINSETGRIHCRFNQVGADTGRISSSDPNMQNIPSKNNEIRQMFIATPGYYLISCDYSQQEPRLLAHMSNDKKMIKAYAEDKDLYAVISSIIYGKSYENYLEYFPDGTANKEGKKIRNNIKQIVLATCYGKGIKALAEDLKIKVTEAQDVYDRIMKEFPNLKGFMLESEGMARDLGYVTTVWGRKRRLPNMQLEPYVIEVEGDFVVDKDPLSFDDIEDITEEKSQHIKNKYKRLLSRTTYWKDRDKIKDMAQNEGVNIKDNGFLIAEATRQCVNSRIQGSAADQIKIAMIKVGNDKQLKKLGFRLLLTVHDELIGEVPKENVKEATKLFENLMLEAGKNLNVKSKCDLVISERWYGKAIEI